MTPDPTELARFVRQWWRDLRCLLFTHDHDETTDSLSWHCRRCDRLGFHFSPFVKRPPLRRLGCKHLKVRP